MLTRSIKMMLISCLAVSLLLGEIRHLPSKAQSQQQPIQSDGTLRRIYIPILMYHYISPLPPDSDDIRINLTVEPNQFNEQMYYLKNAGYSTVSLYEVDNALNNGSPLPPKPIVLTFDDGHLDHYTYVLPILREFRFTATFFIITTFADRNLPEYLSWQQIHEMSAAGMSMESHTKSHVDLRNRSYDFLVYEILGSIESLTAFTHTEPSFFAYPGGQYDDATLALLQQTNIARAVTTQTGANQTTTNRLEMPRIRVSHDTNVGGLQYLLDTTRIKP